MEERFKFRHVHAITGTFIIIALLLMIGTVVWTARSQQWFRSNVTLRIILPKEGAAGIRQGSEVYFLGTLVGAVSDVTVDENGRMEARTSIRRDFFQFMRVDSSAVVKRKFGVVGDTYFEITRGHGAPLPEKNAVIICHESQPSALETTLEEIRVEAVPALKKLSAGLDAWTKLGADIGETRQQLNQFIARLDRIIADVEQGKGTVGKLMTDGAAADELKALLVKANHSMDELQVTLANLQKASDDIQKASANLPAISDAASKEAKDLPGLVLQTQQMLHEMERLIEGAQQHWLLRKYIEQPQPKTRLPPSEVAP